MVKQNSWNQKLETSKTHLVKRLDKNFAGMQKGQMMLVPSAKLLDRFIQKITVNQMVDVVTLRELLAKKHKAEVCCPVATGFALKIVAEAAFEKLSKGIEVEDITPVWRVLDKDSKTLQKVSFDREVFLELRAAEIV
ncbi:MAG: hypothetical protein KTR16_11905 [Acidiferrobacterales bacterium]|nr:hypothetical protein [Acidiferrobacterales bacterium]